MRARGSAKSSNRSSLLWCAHCWRKQDALKKEEDFWGASEANLTSIRNRLREWSAKDVGDGCYGLSPSSRHGFPNKSFPG